ncbi:hypothetical protein C5167_011119 [Papaver somniferum]|uniref:Uncharacterized protein n=1 Tax=Papaver somniferum TaxID=3469 RepID=A0A4Y7K269_PAPSO|nr:hypothetical protein C5167_011119 [Papaver somniferum]
MLYGESLTFSSLRLRGGKKIALKKNVAKFVYIEVFQLTLYKQHNEEQTILLPSKLNWHHISSFISHSSKSRFRHFKVLSWEIAPTTIFIWKSIVGCAEICDGDRN